MGYLFTSESVSEGPSIFNPVLIISGFGFPQKYACVPVAISIGAINARQAGAMPFSIGPETSESVSYTHLDVYKRQRHH